MKIILPSAESGEAGKAVRDLLSSNDASPFESSSMKEAAESGEDVIMVYHTTGRIFVGRGRVYGTAHDAIRNIEERAKRVQPKADNATLVESPFYQDVRDICNWFYRQPCREAPASERERLHIMNEVRLTLEKEMPDTDPPKRAARLRAVLEAAIADDFWSKQIISLGGLRKKGINGRPKWKNAETGLGVDAAGARAATYTGGDQEWRERYQ